MTPTRATAWTSVANLGHGYDSLALAVDLAADIVTVSPADRDTLTVGGPQSDSAPADFATNTATVAITALREAHQLRDPIHVHIEKHVRSGSGTGSSAASAAAAVFAYAAACDLGLSREELTRFAAEGERASAGTAHPDNVAAALFGGFTICWRDPHPLVVPLAVPQHWRFVLARPEQVLRTEASRAAVPATVTIAEHVAGCAGTARIVAALARNDVRLFGAAIQNGLVDRARAPLITGFAAARDAALSAGAVGVCLAGSGPTLMAVTADAENAEGIAAAMRDGFAASGVRSESFVTAAAQGARLLPVGD